MGACCSSGERPEEFLAPEWLDEKDGMAGKDYDHYHLKNGDGARVRFHGSSKFISMYTQQGRKGVNQDAMTAWENFNGEKENFFCGVFDGHGPSGHEVARLVRDNLPTKLSSMLKHSNINASNKENEDKSPLSASWESSFIRSFEDLDEELADETSINTYSSGTTAVTVVKQGDHLLIANLGDSRAVLCTRDDNDQLVPVQLTVDLKPSLPDEANRIRSRGGRVFAMDEEPEVFRVWMPKQDCPGLAMARAFGDFCLKDFGLISTPQVSHRKVTNNDEFVILATDGVWDVLSNSEVIRIVASARKQSIAARLLVDRAIRAWRYRYPTSKVDDIAVVCLFFKERPILTNLVSEGSELSKTYSEVGGAANGPKKLKSDDGLDTVINCEATGRPKDGLRELSRSRSQGLTRRRRVKDL